MLSTRIVVGVAAVALLAGGAACGTPVETPADGTTTPETTRVPLVLPSWLLTNESTQEPTPPAPTAETTTAVVRTTVRPRPRTTQPQPPPPRTTTITTTTTNPPPPPPPPPPPTTSTTP